ncbi:hypothetical protein ACHAW6_007855 [Cyclotella cf. meneghiniana]
MPPGAAGDMASDDADYVGTTASTLTTSEKKDDDDKCNVGDALTGNVPMAESTAPPGVEPFSRDNDTTTNLASSNNDNDNDNDNEINGYLPNETAANERNRGAVDPVLPPPKNPPCYAEAEAVEILRRNSPYMAHAADEMIRRRLVPWKKKRLFQLLAAKKSIEDTVIDDIPRRTTKPETGLDVPPTEARDLLLRRDLPPPPNPPYYTKLQTIDLLSKFKKRRAIMEEIVERRFVPVSVGQLYGMMKRIKDGESRESVAASSWRVRETTGGSGGGRKRRRSHVEEEEKEDKTATDMTRRHATEKQRVNVSRTFMRQVRSLEDGEFVRHVALEFERRGYVLGLKLGVREKAAVTNHDDDNDEEVAPHGTKDPMDSGAASSTVENRLSTDDDKNRTVPTLLPTNIVFYPSTTQHPPHDESKWHDMFSQLKSFHREHGHIRVPPTNKPLSAWVNRQLSQWKHMQRMGVRHSMSADRVQRLHALGFGEEAAVFSSETQGDDVISIPPAAVEAEKKRAAKSERLWDQRFEELRAFKESYGTTVVPRHINDLLSKWAYKQRIYCKQFRQGVRTTPLTQERLEKLEEIGFDTSGDFKAVRDDQRQRNKIKAEKAWEEKFNELVAFKEMFGHCDVKEKKGKDFEYNKLAGWVGLQRTKYKKRMKGMIHGRTFEITDEQIKKLASIGFNFAGKILDFEARFKQLLEFVKEFGHTRVPVFYSEHDNLGRWAKRMRDGIRMNEPWVNEIHKARLLGIGFDIEARQVFDHPRKKRGDAESAELDFQN